MLSTARTRIALVASAASVAALTAGAGLATADPPHRQAGAIYVSPQGNDHNPGTRRDPVRTLQRAQHLVRARTRHAGQDITVTIENGTYRLDEPLTFTAADSGNSRSNVSWQAAPGARPVISGGHRLTDWHLQDATHNIWRAKVPAGADSRQFYVDGMRAQRARHTVKAKDYQATKNGLTTTDPIMAKVRNPQDVQVVMVQHWKDQRCPVVSVSGADITMMQPCWDNTQLQGAGFDIVSWLENAYEFLDQPGEYYLDTHSDTHAGYLYYIPRTGQDLRHADAELPIAQTLIDVAGTPDNPVHDITFRGLTFAYATWLGPNGADGFALGQAGVRLVGTGHVPSVNGHPTDYYVQRQLRGELMPGNVSVSYAHDVSFDRDTFTHLGAAGLALGLGAQRNSVTGSTFTDISGNGLEFGDVSADAHHPADPRMVTADNTVQDSVITNAAAEYLDCVGVLAGYTRHTTIDHNTITDLPYSGISVGWGWGMTDPEASGGDPRHDGVYRYVPFYDTPTTSADNQITNNRIDDVLHTLIDGAAIYTLGAQRNTLVAGNYVSNILGGSTPRIDAPAVGLYSDEGTRYSVWRDNVVANTAYWLSLWNQFSIQGNLYTRNYTNVADKITGAAAQNIQLDNTVVTGDQWPAAAQQIMHSAGARH